MNERHTYSICGIFLPPTSLVNQEGDSHLDLDLEDIYKIKQRHNISSDTFCMTRSDANYTC